MSVIDFHVLVQAILYFFIFIEGFIISIPVGVNKSNFEGICILYASWDKSVVTGSMDINCNFPIYYSVFGLIFYGLAKGLYYMYAVIKSRKDPDTGSQMWVWPFILVNSLQAGLTLVVACILSVGFLEFCKGLKAKSCGDYENNEWKTIGDKKFDTKNYFKLLTVAQIAAWTCVLLWLLQLALSIIRLVRNRRRRSSDMMDKAMAKNADTDKTKIGEVEPSA